MFAESTTTEEISLLPLASFSGSIAVIDSVGPQFDAAIRYLSRQKKIGFDTETRPCFSAHQPHYDVSLLQLSGPGRAFLFRVNKLGMHKKLCKLLANPGILKIGAAVHDDIRGLQKLAPYKPAGFVDLQRIVSEYGIRDKSVKKMSAIILSVRVSKTQQLSNWEADVLSDAQQMYAATDAWICLKMYDVLMKSEKNPLPPVLPEKQQ